MTSDKEPLEAKIHLGGSVVECTEDELLRTILDEAERLAGSSIDFLGYVDENQKDFLLQVWLINTRENLYTVDAKGKNTLSARLDDGMVVFIGESLEFIMNYQARSTGKS